MTIDAVMREMLAKGWKPAGPAHRDHVEAVEREFDVTLPSDYRAYLLAAGGGETSTPEAYTGLWPAKALLPLNRRFRFPWNFPGLVGIGNDGFLVYAYDFRDSLPVIVSLGLSSSVWADVVTDADTFVEWLERRLPP